MIKRLLLLLAVCFSLIVAMVLLLANALNQQKPEAWLKRTSARIQSHKESLKMLAEVDKLLHDNREDRRGEARVLIQELTGWNSFVLGLHTNTNSVDLTVWIIENNRPVRGLCIFDGVKPQPDLIGHKLAVTYKCVSLQRVSMRIKSARPQKQSTNIDRISARGTIFSSCS